MEILDSTATATVTSPDVNFSGTTGVDSVARPCPLAPKLKRMRHFLQSGPHDESRRRSCGPSKRQVVSRSCEGCCDVHAEDMVAVLGCRLKRLELKLEQNTKYVISSIVGINSLHKVVVENSDNLKAIRLNEQPAASSPTQLQCNVCMHAFPNVDEEDATNYVLLLGCGVCLAHCLLIERPCGVLGK